MKQSTLSDMKSILGEAAKVKSSGKLATAVNESKSNLSRCLKDVDGMLDRFSALSGQDASGITDALTDAWNSLYEAQNKMKSYL